MLLKFLPALKFNLNTIFDPLLHLSSYTPSPASLFSTFSAWQIHTISHVDVGKLADLGAESSVRDKSAFLIFTFTNPTSIVNEIAKIKALPLP